MNFELRVAGPDTIDVMTDELEALRWANAINKQYLADRAMHPDNEVLCVATVYAVDIGENLPELPTCTKSQTATSDEIYELIEGAANTLRGMTLDPAIPPHAKGAMREKIQELEKALEKLLIELEG